MDLMSAAINMHTHKCIYNYLFLFLFNFFQMRPVHQICGIARTVGLTVHSVVRFSGGWRQGLTFLKVSDTAANS